MTGQVIDWSTGSKVIREMTEAELAERPTEEQAQAAALAARLAEAKAECGRRICAVAAQHTQINIIGNHLAGLLGEADEAAYLASVQWIADMRAAAATIAAGDLDMTDDANWPDCPAEAAALAARF